MAASVDDEHAALWGEIERAVKGGKHFRAALVTRAHAGLGGVREKAAVQVAAAFELMHTGFLMHDDLIDHDTMRRGEPNLAAVMFERSSRHGTRARAERIAHASALLAGDVLLGMAHHAFATVDAPARVHAQLQVLLAEALLVSIAGELDDVTSELRRAPMAHAMRVAEAKTAMYSFQAPLRAAAILAESDAPTLHVLDKVGQHLGIAFQLGDDLLGTFAPEDTIGKSNLSDLREGKCTTLLLLARGMPVWSDIEMHVGRPDLNQTTAGILRRALANSEAPGAVRAQAQSHLDTVMATGAGSLPMQIRMLISEISSMIAGMLDDAWHHVLLARGNSSGEV
jgi:geranylgeranyl diphosphate synthase type II